jgi:hypothetical protein
MLFQLTIQTLEGKILKFKTSKYELKDGHIEFIDTFTGLKKSFPSESVNIDEIRERDGEGR